MYFKQDLCKAIDIHEYDLNTVVKLGEALDQVRKKNINLIMSTVG